MTSLNLSSGAISYLNELGFEYDEERIDEDYLENLYAVAEKEDIRIGLLAVELEEAGLYPSGLGEDHNRVGYLDEIFNALVRVSGQ